jgi:GT2 family glycosyltransferase
MKYKVSIVIVTFKSGKILKKSLKSIYSSTLKPVEIIIVNNGPKEDLEYIQTLKYPNFKIIQNKQNVGFAKANNQGIKIAKGKYILIMNPDVILKKDTLSKCFNFMEKNKKVNILGCKLKNSSTKKIEDSARKFPTLASLFLRRFLFKKTYDYPLTKINNLIKVDWVCGAFMFMRKKYLFDENYFLYFEDVDLCRKVENVFYHPKIIAFHIPKRESRRNLKFFWVHLKSMLYYFRKWGFKLF